MFSRSLRNSMSFTVRASITRRPLRRQSDPEQFATNKEQEDVSALHLQVSALAVDVADTEKFDLRNDASRGAKVWKWGVVYRNDDCSLSTDAPAAEPKDPSPSSPGGSGN